MQNDYFKTDGKTGARYAGDHILMDIYGASFLQDAAYIEKIMRISCIKAGAEVIFQKYHSFGKGLGVSGVTILSESHASIHTWPERRFASIDVFMCGNADARKAADMIRKLLVAERYVITPVLRGTELERKGD